MSRFDASEVRRYYDRNTPAFVRFGQGGSVGAIHRAVWGPGVATRAQAFRYVEDRISALTRSLLPASGTLHVVDLGCGVGASLCYLTERLPIRGTGVTVSPIQARWAAQHVRESGLSDRVACVEGDYCNLPPGLGQADLAYAIESFVHAPAPDRFFAQCARLIRADGVLVICDDFLRAPAGSTALRTVERFTRGWRINALLRRDQLQALARSAGFEHESTVDLTPYLETRRVRDRAIAALVAMFGWLLADGSRFDHLIGGSALQTCLARGWIGYELAVFRRRSGESGY